LIQVNAAARSSVGRKLKRRSFAPFQYSRVIWAILPDYFAFDHIPEPALVGSIVTITGEGCLS
jgi:hypothetical protein